MTTYKFRPHQHRRPPQAFAGGWRVKVVEGPLEGKLGTVTDVKPFFGTWKYRVSLDDLGNRFWFEEDLLEESNVPRKRRGAR